jgi:hypothetical protein
MMMRRRAYSYGRTMSWPVVGGAYVRVFEELTGIRSPVADRSRRIAADTFADTGARPQP